MIYGRGLHAVSVTRFVSPGMRPSWWRCGQEGAAPEQRSAMALSVERMTSLQLKTVAARRTWEL